MYILPQFKKMPSKTTASRNNKDKRCSPAQNTETPEKKKKRNNDTQTLGIRQHKTNPPERGKNEVSHIMSPTYCMDRVSRL